MYVQGCVKDEFRSFRTCLLKRTEARGLGTRVRAEKPSGFCPERVSYLFNVQKVFGLKVDSRALDWTLLIQYATVADIGPHSKCHRFVLGKTQSISILEPDFVKLTGIFYKTVSSHWETPSSQPHQ